MKRNIYTLTISLIVMFCTVSIFAQQSVNAINPIRLNSLGYTPKSEKIITIVAKKCAKVILKKAEDNSIVFQAKVTGPFNQQDMNLVYWKADFTGFQATGNYYVEVVDLAKSNVFPVNQDVYNYPYYTAMRGFYLWRCGAGVTEIVGADTFSHAACHMDDGHWDYTEVGKQHTDGTGGWHDAGDYGKYTVNAGITLSNLFFTWQLFGEKLKSIPLNLPVTAGEMPEFLEELKWETDYILKMEFPDGSGRVSHKLTRLNFEPFVLPELDTTSRYFSEWSTNANANFSAIMAMAARFFKPYNPEYAAKCLEAGIRSYKFLMSNPTDVPCNFKDFNTGTYQANDKQARLWAASELWETTGDAVYLSDFEKMTPEFAVKVDVNWDWSDVKNLGMFTYLLSKRDGKNPDLYKLIKNDLMLVADSVIHGVQSDAFGRPFNKYYWGCNGTIARISVTLGVANQLNPDEKWLLAAQEIVAHIFGKNNYGRSFVTGLGVNPPMHPHDRRSGGDNVINPWPGYLVGGGHNPTGWLDKEESYSTNEIAINWQAPLVYLLAWMAAESN
jgi:endoglucanase